MHTFFSIIIILLVTSSTVRTKIPINDRNSKEYFTEYTKLAVYMAKRYISPKTNTLVICEKSVDTFGRKENYQTLLLEDILHRLSGNFALQLFIGNYNDRLWDYNIFIVDSYEAFKLLSYTFPVTTKERFFNFFILLIWSSNDEMERYKNLHKIFNLCLRLNVRNVVIMSKPFAGSSHMSFYSYELYSKGDCRKMIAIREINRYENGLLKSNLLFPDHINNYYGCVFNVSAHQMRPLLIFNGDMNNQTHLMENYRLSGIEGELLNTVAKALNFKFRLRFPRGRNYIEPYLKSSGCFGDLDRNRAQIALGGFSSAEPNSEKYTISVVYHNTQYVFVVRSDLCFGPIKQLLNPYCTSVWICILVLFFTSYVFTKILENYPNLRNFFIGSNNMPICSMIAIFLGNAVTKPKIPRGNFARFILMAWLLLSFEIRNGYQGKMFDSLRLSKRVPVPQRISQLLDHSYTLLSISYNRFYPANKTIIMRNSNQRFDMVQRSSTKMAATGLLDTLAYYNFMNYNTSSLTYVEESIYSFPCVMYFHKHSMLRSSIDRKLKLLYDAGIISYFVKKHVRSKYQNMNTGTQFESWLVNGNLRGLYYVKCVMYLIALLIFILELLTGKSRRLQMIMDKYYS
ncbi:uncharacterized protein ACRADG_010112 [Cochliomyia hominivorax]